MGFTKKAILLINPPDYGQKTFFCFQRPISHPECAIFQGGLIRY